MATINIIAIETTGQTASVAFVDDDGKTLEIRGSGQLNHLQYLMTMIDDLLKECKKTLDDITHIAVSEGPGSFTGIRIGVTTARALAQARGLKTIGVPTLESFLFHDAAERSIVCPVFDARRNQVYGAAYFLDERGKRNNLVADGAYDVREFLDLLDQAVKDRLTDLPERRIAFYGDGRHLCRNLLKSDDDEGGKLGELALLTDLPWSFADGEEAVQRAGSVAALGLAMAQEGRWKTFEELKPIYLRKAEAERKLEEAGEKVKSR